MSRKGLLSPAFLFALMVTIPCTAFAQLSSSGGYGSRQANPLSMMNQAGPSNPKNGAESPDVLLRNAKRHILDADPRVRVDALESLRFVEKPDVNELLLRGLSDPDIRVRVKAIDVLGARGVADAVPTMAQMLVLNETPVIEKFHIVAALGRIGDSHGVLPVIEYLKDTRDSDSRGTAVFALGEMGDPRANDALIQLVNNDPDPKVRRLAQEALEKIDGELPNHHQAELAAAREKSAETTDQKLSKLRQFDNELQSERY
jgi:HEAT repeat protein